MAHPLRSPIAATRPRSSGSPRASSRRPSDLVRCTPSARGRPLLCHPERANGVSESKDPLNLGGCPSTLFPRADPGPGCRASLIGIVGMITRSIPPRLCRSSRPQVQSRRNTKSPLGSDFVRRVHAGEGPKSAGRLRRPRTSSARCRFRLLLRPQTRRNLAPASGRHLTTSPGPRDEALHSSDRRRTLF